MNEGQEEISKAFSLFEQRLGKLLSPSDVSVIVYIVNDLKLSFEVISLILEYALSKGIKSIRYIEKIAMDWADRGINDKEKAERFMAKLKNLQIGYLKGKEASPEARKNKFNNYTDTNKVDFKAHKEEVLREMLGE